MKRFLCIYMSILLVLCLASCAKEKTLPLPELEEGMRGQLGIDKNINEATIDEYLGRTDEEIQEAAEELGADIDDMLRGLGSNQDGQF